LAKFRYHVGIFGEVEAGTEDQARVIVETGININLRLQNNETLDYDVQVQPADEEDEE
jgi:hypothetical protein